MPDNALTYSLAATAEELDQLFQLNHDTFTREIPQHAAQPGGRLVDRFHQENEYLICKHRSEVVGMLALRAQRPFSLDQKLPDLETWLPRARRICEVRLLVVKPAWRHSRVFAGLVRALAQRCAQRDLDFAIISATTRQLKLYGHIGFRPFGPLTGSGDAMFQPMALSLEDFNAQVAWLAMRPEKQNRELQQKAPAAALPRHLGENHSLPDGKLKIPAPPPLLLTPGPVQLHAQVRAALAESLQPHRSEEVLASLSRCNRALRTLTGADCAQLQLGSGTLANDAIAQQLRAYGYGLVLANGEFGERLVDHCARAALDFDTCRAAWGEEFDFANIAASLQRPPAWIWMAHCETSTGMRNDFAACSALARKMGAQLALDCISTIGNQPLDLAGVLFASGVSGKGIGSAPGLAFVLHRRDALRAVEGVPRVLDLQFAAARGGMPFTQSSSLLAALDAALELITPAHFERIAGATVAAHGALTAAGISVIAPSAVAAHGVVTLALPHWLPAVEAGRSLLQQGFRIAFDSQYLLERNWVQMAWMGQVDTEHLVHAVAQLGKILRRKEK